MTTEFKQGSPILFCIGFGLIFIVCGVVMLFVKPLIGVGALLVGIVMPLVVYYVSSSYVIQCSDTGFIVDETSKRKGSKHSEFRWVDVTKTVYEEIESSRDSDGTTSPPVKHFSVFCGETRAFKVDKIKGFADLINLFNQRAVNVPYTWQPQTGVHVNIGIVSVSRQAYVSVPRA